ncbi:hypothetical protein ACQEU6_23850 [Spirillospora sp. CA-108201]
MGEKLSVSLHEDTSGVQCLSFYRGDLGLPGTAIRPHSSCLFGEAICAEDCDCRTQLQGAFREIHRRGRGAVIYLFQEGRGAGLLYKIRGLEIQRVKGINSFAAYKAMGLPPDLRNYSMTKTALADIGVGDTVILMSNSPTKRAALEEMGYAVVDQLQLPCRISRHALPELLMKKEEGNHKVDFSKITFFD